MAKAEKKFWIYVDLGTQTLKDKLTRKAGPRKTAQFVRDLIARNVGGAKPKKAKAAPAPAPAA